MIYFLVSSYDTINTYLHYVIITILITGLAINPPNKTVIYHNLTLTCVPNILYSAWIDYQWHRVSGQIPAKAVVVKDDLTIPSIVPEDQGQYYCTSIQFGHCAESNHVTVETDGEKITYKYHLEEY